MLFYLLFLFAFKARSTGAAASDTSFIATSSRRESRMLSRCNRYSSPSFLAAIEDNKSSDTSKSARERGIYSRPSAAIERGSGFFIPGLEGPRIRLIFGMTVLVAGAANHFFAESQPGDIGQYIAESTAAFYGVLLLFQGIVESGGQKSSKVMDASLDANEGVMGSHQNRGAAMVSGHLETNKRALESVQKAAKTIIDFTPTSYVTILDKDEGIIYSLSTSMDSASRVNSDEQSSLIALAIDALSESRGGRVALPSEHPVAELLPSSATRCILVQKLNEYEGACLVLGSDNLLPSFTKNDLRWIGQLAATIKF